MSSSSVEKQSNPTTGAMPSSPASHVGETNQQLPKEVEGNNNNNNNNVALPEQVAVRIEQHDHISPASQGGGGTNRVVYHPPSSSRPPSNEFDRFIRVMLFFFAAMFILFIVIPLFTEEALSAPPVSMQPIGFSISNYTYNWESEFSFGCETCMSSTKTYYSAIDAHLSYGKTYDRFSEVAIDSFSLKGKEQKKVNVKSGQINQKEEIVAEAAKKEETKFFQLELTMTLELAVRYKLWGFFWGVRLFRGGPYESFCWKLLVSVNSETGQGRLLTATRTHCY